MISEETIITLKRMTDRKIDNELQEHPRSGAFLTSIYIMGHTMGTTGHVDVVIK